MAGEKAVHHQKTLLEILSGANGAREKNAFSSTDEGVLLSHDGAIDSALEAREALDAGEGLAALNPGQKAIFSAGGGPVVGEGSVVTKASAARVLVGGGLSIAAAFALAAAATWIMSQFATPTLEIPLPAVLCGTPPGGSFFGVLRLLAGCP